MVPEIFLAPSPGCQDEVPTGPPQRTHLPGSSHSPARQRRPDILRGNEDRSPQLSTAPVSSLPTSCSPSRGSAEVRVVREIGAQADSHTYGIAFVDETLDFWKMDFPPRPSLKERPAALDLECSICHTPITLERGEFEFDICAIHGGLVRYCDSCA